MTSVSTTWAQLVFGLVVIVATATVTVTEIKATTRVLGAQLETLAEVVSKIDCHMDEVDMRHYELRDRVTRMEQ